MKWRFRESRRRDPGGADILARWMVRLESEDNRIAYTYVDVSRSAAVVLEAGGEVAPDTRQALQTQGRSAVEAALKGGHEPPGRIVCSTDGCRPES